MDSVRPASVLRVTPSGSHHAQDVAATEEPLEIRLSGHPFVTTMRTPGRDRDLAAGFLFAERIVRRREEIADITAAADGNSVTVEVEGDAAARAGIALAGRRLVTATSACGVCGRQSIDDLMVDLPVVAADWKVKAVVIPALIPRLREAQTVFAATGGLHAAGLFDGTGELITSAEDVGRHNAVDKVIGSQLLDDRLPLHDRMLVVSGRTSFEILQKAVVAGIPIVAAVSAPSSLAIELAERAGVTLLGFVRGDAFNIYTGGSRIVT